MSIINRNDSDNQKGLVSIFVVIFSALLLTVLTIGFIRIMIQEQKQASDSDLAQSAYDSAVAGVEDGKRVLRACQQSPGGAACNAIAANQCNTVAASGIVSGASETTIKTNGSSDVSLNQAYTCVKISPTTDNVQLNLTEGESTLIPLRATASFRTIRVQWMHKNTGDGTYIGGSAASLSTPTTIADLMSLPQKSAWSTSAPSFLRVQSMLPPAAASVSLAALDTGVVSTAFLRPSLVTAASATVTNVSIGLGRSTGATNYATSTSPILCSNTDYIGGDYACTAHLDAPANIPANSTVAYLRLTSLYRDTSVSVSLLDSSNNVVQLNGVQPIIDSTGRASNVFRRISSRVSPVADRFPFPEYAVDITGNLCKSFYITPTTSATASPACSTTPDYTT